MATETPATDANCALRLFLGGAALGVGLGLLIAEYRADQYETLLSGIERALQDYTDELRKIMLESQVRMMIREAKNVADDGK